MYVSRLWINMCLAHSVAAAFCFYNLSSIVNGLVYFDQLQLIKVAHLLLVTLGIVVLLGGVWVVSVQAGGGGVDLGTWDTEDFADDGVDVPVVQGESEETDRSVAVLDETDSEATINSIANLEQALSSPRLRATRSEPLQVLSASSSRTLGREAPRVEIPQSSHQRHTTYSVNALVSPPAFRSRFFQRTSTTEGGSLQFSPLHQRRSSHPSTFAPPFNTVSALGAGLQIGISAVSPGFSIVPRERRRKASGLGLGATEVEVNFGGGTVVGNSERAIDDTEISNSTRAGGDSPRQRWKWLKDLLF
jgi:hypothetical protein